MGSYRRDAVPQQKLHGAVRDDWAVCDERDVHVGLRWVDVRPQPMPAQYLRGVCGVQRHVRMAEGFLDVPTIVQLRCRDLSERRAMPHRRDESCVPAEGYPDDVKYSGLGPRGRNESIEDLVAQ